MKFLPRSLGASNRAVYRVHAGGEGARVWVGLKTGPAEAILEDVSSQGCGVFLTAEQAELVGDLEEFVLRLQIGGKTMSQLFVKGVIRSRRPSDDGVRFGLEFLDPERLYTQLKEPQWRYFNRRRAFRVEPADSHGRPLRAKFFLPGAKEPRSLALHDLSSTGLSVALRPNVEVRFPEQSAIRVVFTLPSDMADVDLRVRFVHSTPRGGRRRVGFEVIENETPDIEETQERVLKYVLDRQRQLLTRGSS